jgi:uncharacterized protein YjbI with pentapeptide repeats
MGSGGSVTTSRLQSRESLHVFLQYPSKLFGIWSHRGSVELPVSELQILKKIAELSRAELSQAELSQAELSQAELS